MKRWEVIYFDEDGEEYIQIVHAETEEGAINFARLLTDDEFKEPFALEIEEVVEIDNSKKNVTKKELLKQITNLRKHVNNNEFENAKEKSKEITELLNNK